MDATPAESAENGATRAEVLVTGGCGYLGSHIVRELHDAGFLPVVLDDLSSGHLEALAGVASYRLYQADLGDVFETEAIFRQHVFRGVVHCAAVTRTGEEFRDPERFYASNSTAGLTLLRLCTEYEVDAVVFASSCAVYGALERLPASEDQPGRPANAYGCARMNFERALAGYHAAYGLRYLVLRCFNLAGAHPAGDMGEDHDPETHLIPNALRTALGKRETLAINGRDYPTPDGTCLRDYIHVSDAARAHVAALRRLLAGGPDGVVNVGSGQGRSVLEVIRMCEQVTGRAIKTVDGLRREGDMPALVADTARAREWLAFHPERSDLATIVADAWQWVSRHPDGYRS